MKALVGAFSQEKALEVDFSMIIHLHEGSFAALVSSVHQHIT